MPSPEVYSLGRLIADIYANEVGVPLKSVGSFTRYLGGSAGNIAVGLARHGSRVGMISRVGQDQHGEFLLDVLHKNKIDTAMVKADESASTGLAFAALRPPSDSELLFYCDPCAYQHLSPTDLDLDAISQAKLLVVGGSALSVSPSREATFIAMQTNRASGGVNVMDIDWRPMLWKSLGDARLYYQIALGLADVVLANEPELAFAGGSSDPYQGSAAILAFGPKEVVAKRGGDGVLYFGPDGERRQAAFPIEVLNTLGAGDGFGAAYAYGLLQGWPVERRLEYASAAGAIVVTRHSCSEAMPTAAEVESFLDSNHK